MINLNIISIYRYKKDKDTFYLKLGYPNFNWVITHDFINFYDLKEEPEFYTKRFDLLDKDLELLEYGILRPLTQDTEAKKSIINYCEETYKDMKSISISKARYNNCNLVLYMVEVAVKSGFDKFIYFYDLESEEKKDVN